MQHKVTKTIEIVSLRIQFWNTQRDREKERVCENERERKGKGVREKDEIENKKER